MSSCSCADVCGWDDGEAVACYRRRVVKARMLCRCYECAAPIARGDMHQCETGVSDGRWFTTRTCLDCASVQESFFGCGWVSGGVWEDLREHIEATNGEISSACLVSLTPAARVRVCELIEEEWERQERC